MKVFICWSGQRGLRIAEALKEWLPSVLDNRVEAHVSSGIDKGALWREELQRELHDSQAGILCLTPEALRSPWINYEAGMLARDLGVFNPACRAQPGNATRRLFTFLLGVKASDLDGPLAAFQSTDGTDSDDTHRLVHALFSSLPREGDMEQLADNIVTSWPQNWQSLSKRFAVIPKLPLSEVWPEFATLFRRKTFDEPTSRCISQDWLARYGGAREAAAAVVAHRARVEGGCRHYVVELLRDLELALDEYAMATSQLIGRPRFPIGPDGSVRIDPEGLAVACEARRARVRRLVARAADPAQAPFFDAAAHFETLEEFTERENFVHRMMPLVKELAERVHALSKPSGMVSSAPTKRKVTADSLERWPEPAACFRLILDALGADLPPPPVQNARNVDVQVQFRTTDWDFDRIMYAVYLKHRLSLSAPCPSLPGTAVEFAEIALERARLREVTLRRSSETGGRTTPAGSAATMLLWYALAAVDALNDLQISQGLSERVAKLASDAAKFAEDLGTQHDLLRELAEKIRKRPARPEQPAQLAAPVSGVPQTVNKAIAS